MTSTPTGEYTDGRGARPLPPAGIDGFLSHFVLALEFFSGDLVGQLASFSLPSAVQTVARSDPFAYRGARANHSVEFPLPEQSRLPRRIAEPDFLVRPAGVFAEGRQTVWLQILNLDAKGDTPLGPVRIILGETFLREYPNVFEPSYGAAQAIDGDGFPAVLFFSPNAVIETPFGAFKTRPKALVGDRIDDFPPVGSYPRLQEPVGLDPVDRIEEVGLANVDQLQAVAQVSGLSHPIDALLLTGDPYQKVQARIG